MSSRGGGSRGRGLGLIESSPSSTDRQPTPVDDEDYDTPRLSRQLSQTGSTCSVGMMYLYRTESGGMSSRSATSSTRNIIDWNADRTNVFIDICVQNIDARAHRVAHWCEEISSTFNVRTGLNYNSSHMKNKFDNMKRDWNAWNKLLQISGGYWNEELDIVGGSDEWWATVESSCRKYKTGSPARFRELDVMFSGCMQTDKCQFIIPPQPPVGLTFEARIIGDYLCGDTEGISSRRGPRQHFTGASSSTSEYDLIISTCMEVQQEGDDYEEWEVAICAARCAATGGPNPLAALLHKPAQLRRAIIHFVNQFRSEN